MRAEGATEVVAVATSMRTHRTRGGTVTLAYVGVSAVSYPMLRRHKRLCAMGQESGGKQLGVEGRVKGWGQGGKGKARGRGCIDCSPSQVVRVRA